MHFQKKMYISDADHNTCCLCFEINCGVNTLLFLTFVSVFYNFGYAIISAYDENWFGLGHLVLVLPKIYVVFYALRYTLEDNFHVRYNISLGFQYVFVLSLLWNCIFLIIAASVISAYWDDPEFRMQILEIGVDNMRRTN